MSPTIRSIAEHFDAHRKRQRAFDPNLTLTGRYNVLEKVRASEELTTEDRAIYGAVLVGVLRDYAGTGARGQGRTARHANAARQQIAAGFKPASRTNIAQVLEALTTLGQSRRVEDRYLL